MTNTPDDESQSQSTLKRGFLGIEDHPSRKLTRQDYKESRAVCGVVSVIALAFGLGVLHKDFKAASAPVARPNPAPARDPADRYFGAVLSAEGVLMAAMSANSHRKIRTLG